MRWILPALLTFALTGQAPDERIVDLDAHAPSAPFPHVWERMFGSGRAILSLRESYRADLREVKRATGFDYIRFHGILDDEVGVYAKGAYNFSYVDQIYDGLLANGVRPFVELSFMPKDLAANPVPHPFWYKPYPSPPKDPGAWQALITAFVRHLQERYGAAETENWYFEVWNEPNIDFWNGEPKLKTYFDFYGITASAIKAVDPKLKVGGPATAQAAWVGEFIDFCKRSGAPFDFVSTHIYGNETKDPHASVAPAVRKAHEQAGPVPLIITEYNATYLNDPEITDSVYMGPWLANDIAECDGLSSMMSYWDFSDVFEEQGVVKTPFYGGYGLIAERGIPKPAFRAFEMLHRLGDRRISNTTPGVLITKRGERFILGLWSDKQTVFRLRGRGAGYSLQVLDKDHGNALAAWRSMGAPPYPTPAQINELVKASRLGQASSYPLSRPIRLMPKSLALVEVR